MPSNNDILSLRKEYRLHSLSKNDVNDDPVLQFESWWKQAIESNLIEPNAMTLATCDTNDKPSARIVLLKGIRKDGFLFFTNYDSKKGKQIENNRFAALVFLWKELERQVRIEGEIEKINSEESDAYFSSRPRESRIAAWSSPQSKVIQDRSSLEGNVMNYNSQFPTDEIPRPQNWGGYILHPNLIEFWQGRPGRLHDRLQYTINEQKKWKIERLAP